MEVSAVNSTYGYTCNSCMIQFKSSELQRYHMKTEWHRYNLKRRVAQLAPIDADLFIQKLQASQKEQELNQVDEFGFPLLKPINARSERSQGVGHRRTKIGSLNNTGSNLRASTSGYSISSEISRVTEHNSDYGQLTASEYGFTDESFDELESEFYSDGNDTLQDGEDQIILTECPYCGSQSSGLDQNLTHMLKAHGLYIPERKYLRDIKGLVHLIVTNVVIKKRCMCCSFKGSSLESIRAHMKSKSHCRIPYETKEEREALARFYEFNQTDGEEDSPSSEKSVDMEGAKPVDEESPNDPLNAPGEGTNSNYAVVEIDESGVELTLPTGARVGHRSMQRYYRQNPSMPGETSDGRRTVAVGDRRYAGGITEKEYKKNLKDMQSLERQAVNKFIKKQAKRNFQRHYRDELLQ
ncbi:HCL235Cp [Eremothecium sinecaudum]|uniref:HCL235Cp n=1 Tax=Eremothecium sinecaudum TaxID=45286 RepID=A0A0X8HQ53_9SACH|nr:HCL235Cp [Eremothecium sinecaudum]AMD19916.1 HCL235Cp [Eremothecium sinecaudum]